MGFKQSLDIVKDYINKQGYVGNDVYAALDNIEDSFNKCSDCGEEITCTPCIEKLLDEASGKLRW